MFVSLFHLFEQAAFRISFTRFFSAAVGVR